MKLESYAEYYTTTYGIDVYCDPVNLYVDNFFPVLTSPLHLPDTSFIFLSAIKVIYEPEAFFPHDIPLTSNQYPVTTN